MSIKVKESFADGEYDKLISHPNEVHPTILLQAMIKSNNTGMAAFHAIGLMQQMLFVRTQEEFNEILMLLKGDNLLQVCIEAVRVIGTSFYDDLFAKDFMDRITKEYRGAIVFPIIWPIAYGDMIVINQFIKMHAQDNKDKKILVIMPLNRPELRQLMELNDSITEIIDITTLPESEGDRHRSLNLMNGNVRNVILQEAMIQYIIKALDDPIIIKLRYLPVLAGFKVYAGKRIWEERANLFINYDKELPKIWNQKRKKKNKITIHLRSGGYNDAEGRDVNNNYAQDLIYRLNDLYSDYEIVRLGDAGMEELDGCTNASHEDLTIKKQAQHIQESKLFIGTHSAPQHLAIAFSDTPIICFNYVRQETAMIGTDIAKMSYEPVGKQVKHIFYTKMYDANDKEVLPLHNSKEAVRYENTDMDELLLKIKEILG